MSEENSPNKINNEEKVKKMEARVKRDSIQNKIRLFKRSMVIFVVLGIFVFCIDNIIIPIPSSEKNKPLDSFTESDWIEGNRNAKIKIIEYSDFQCPACGAYAPMVKELVASYSAEIGFAYRHFPLRSIHPKAEVAARAAEAAGKQGKFFQLHDILFERQNDWLNDTNSKLQEYAKEIGLDIVQFNKDINSKNNKGLVQADYISAVGYKINSTPTFYVNGQKIQNPKSLDDFIKIIESLNGEVLIKNQE